MSDDTSQDVEVTIEWTETATYRSTVYLNREGLHEFVTNNNPPDAAGGITVQPEADGWVLAYIEAGEESDWFDQVNVSDDLTGITDRTVDSAHIWREGERRA